jgi:uncharacterized beta-barrel protein YwiB (DUF1934 family)
LIPIQIQIISMIQHTPGAKEDVIRQKVPGTLSLRGTDWILRYTEESDNASSQIMVISALNHLKIHRRGPISYFQTYEPQKVIPSSMYTPAGRTEMNVATSYYERQRNEFGGQIDFGYNLSMENTDLGNYRLTIKWTEGNIYERF